jgi:hypothetical protein
MIEHPAKKKGEEKGEEKEQEGWEEEFVSQAQSILLLLLL